MNDEQALATTEMVNPITASRAAIPAAADRMAAARRRRLPISTTKFRSDGRNGRPPLRFPAGRIGAALPPASVP